MHLKILYKIQIIITIQIILSDSFDSSKIIGDNLSLFSE